jgi:hypothetical protein
LNTLAAALESTALAQFLKASQWVYPFVNAGHILGIALLVGAIVPLDLALAGWLRNVDAARTQALLRPFAIVGLVLAAICGGLLFITQAQDYTRNPVFQIKMVLFALALANAAAHLAFPNRVLALVSLALWPGILVLGRMVGYVIG